jgi:hypothetical protein
MTTDTLPLTLPPPEVLAERIALLEQELQQTKRLRRLALAAQRADEARKRRRAEGGQHVGEQARPAALGGHAGVAGRLHPKPGGHTVAEAAAAEEEDRDGRLLSLTRASKGLARCRPFNEAKPGNMPGFRRRSRQYEQDAE